jgi:hypothetical protein
MTASVRRLVLDIPPLMAAYLLFQSLLGLFLDYTWVSHPFGGHMLTPGLLLAINGSMIAPRIPVWRTLPVSSGDIDRARWWHSVGMPGVLLALFFGASVVIAGAVDGVHASWRDIGLSWGGQLTICVVMALMWMALPLARRKWGRWSMLAALPLFLGLIRITTIGHGDLPFSLKLAIPAAILAAAALYLTAGRWPLPQTAASWVAPSGDGVDRPSRLSGWPVLMMANLPVWLWMWALMAFVCLALKYFAPAFDLKVFGLILGMMSAQVAVTQLVAGMRAFRALPLSGVRLSAMLILPLVMVQVISLLLFRLVLEAAGGGALPASALAAPLVVPLLYFPAYLRFGMRVAQIGYALVIVVIAPLQLLAGDAATAPVAIAALGALAGLAMIWTWHEIARGGRAYRVQPLMPARWRGVE